jgi:hypothetical protein
MLTDERLYEWSLDVDDAHQEAHSILFLIKIKPSFYLAMDTTKRQGKILFSQINFVRNLNNFTLHVLLGSALKIYVRLGTTNDETNNLHNCRIGDIFT